MAIVPIRDEEFDISTMMGATWRRQHAPATLTDLDLRHFASYDVKDAERAAAARTKALAKTSEPRTPAPVRARGSGRPLTMKDWDAFAELFIGTIKSLKNHGDARADALEQRLKALEGRAALEYKGVWAADRAYERGHVVTLGGCMWHCQAPTTSRPGADPAAWVLAVKSGRNGRERK